MEGVVAARRLRKSMLNTEGTNAYNVSLGKVNFSNVRKKVKEKEDEEENVSYFKKIKNRFIIKAIITIVLLIICIGTKLLVGKKVFDNKYISMVAWNYKQDHSKEEFLESFEDKVYNIYCNINYIFPDAVVDFIKNGYVKNVKPILLNFTITGLLSGNQNSNSNNSVIIYEEEKKEDENIEAVETVEKVEETEVKNKENVENSSENKEELNGVGGGISENVESSISTQNEDLEAIKKLNIEIAWPVNGTITSRYGVRDEIFEEIGNYHTGLDIANKKGTEIKSATFGKVVKCEQNNKYYGNNIEIENNGVIFKYAHLDEILTNEGKEVSIGEIIGKMGSTGYSTGPHLHFEVRFNGNTLDPELLLS